VHLANQNRLDKVSRSIRDERGRSQGLGLRLQPVPAALDSPERFRLAFESANIGIALVDLKGNFIEVNQELCRIFACAREELESVNMADLAAPGDKAQSRDWRAAMLEGNTLRAVSEGRFLNKKGRILFIEVSYGLARSRSGTPLYFTVSFRDITERKRLEAKLERQASVDPLTGALNRMRIEERGKLELMRSERHGHKLSVVLVDLDHFKLVNDTYGHAAGDLVLSGFGEIARACLRLTDLLGRWGGEEFVLLLPDTGPAGAGQVAERLRATLQDFRFPAGVRATASLGVAGHRPGETLAALIGRADGAMYRAKQAGRNRVLVDPEDLARESAARPQQFHPFQPH
jgi:diguanylate cyclase (GGDEF)-like protein/PAS domain S-box-containing protein